MSNLLLQAMAAPGIYETVMSMLPNVKRKKQIVLDAGSGSGSLSYLLQQKGFHVLACDINPKKFNITGIKCKRADLNEKIPFADNSFDYVISLETIEHLEDPWVFIREAYRVLKPNGILILSTPNVTHIASRITYLLLGRFVYFWSKRYRESAWHINPVFIWELELIFKYNKFKLKQTTYNEGKLFPLFKLFIQNRKIYFGSPISANYLPKNDLFGENLIVLAEKTI